VAPLDEHRVHLQVAGYPGYWYTYTKSISSHTQVRNSTAAFYRFQGPAGLPLHPTERAGTLDREGQGMTIVLVTASLDLKRDGGASVHHYNGYLYSTSNPQQPLGQTSGPRDEVLNWARTCGADEIEIQEPTPEILAVNARQQERQSLAG
jgi:hypothetical protein